MSRPPNLRQAAQALVRAWQPLLIYEMLMSLLSTLALGPLIVVCTYQLVGLSGDAVLGNGELAWFLLSPLGLLALVLLVSMSVGLALLEYAGLILLADAALRETSIPVVRLIRWVLWSSPRLLALAAMQSALAILAAIPFVGMAALVYWILLGDADINYFLAQRPPRFWCAVAMGVVLALGFAVSMVWFFARWALAVPACVLDQQSISRALRSSAHLMRGRAGRLLLAAGAWQSLKYAAVLATIWGLDLANATLLAGFEGQLSAQVWLTGAMLLVDGLVLQLLATLFAVGLAGLLAYEYQIGRHATAETVPPRPPETVPAGPAQPAGRLRAAILVIACAGPVASIAYALFLEQNLVEHRPARVTAHRAGPKSAPENSLAALELSIAAGADLVEIDVQQTADGQVVLMHDRDLRRMTGDIRDVADVTLADLAELRLRSPGESTAEGIPTLAQFIEKCHGPIRLNVELKDFGRSPTLAAAVLDVLRERRFTERAIVSCLQMPPLEVVRQSAPAIPVGIILSASQGDITRLPVNFLSLHQRLVRAELVRRAHQRGLEVHAWSVADRDSALRLLDLGCDNLITSDPALMREVVDGYNGLNDVERMLLRLRRWLRE